jgi:uncharacterized protein GlcG (DUF336 family)
MKRVSGPSMPREASAIGIGGLTAAVDEDAAKKTPANP